MNNKIALVTMEDGLRGTSIRYLSSWLKTNGFSTSLLFLRKPRSRYSRNERENKKEINEIIKFIIDNKFSYVGFSIMTSHFYRAKILTQEIKKKTKGIIIWGGIHPSLMPKECLDAGADIVITRDGEVPLKQILSGFDLSDIRGIAYYKEKRLVTTAFPPENLLPLDSLPFPDFDFDNAFVLDHEKIIFLTIDYYRENTMWSGTYYYLTTTRGCPFRCSYCCNINRGNIRRRSVDDVIQELSYIKKILPFIKGINIQDDSFFLGSDAWLEEFCTKLRKQFNLAFIARLMPKFVTDRRINILKKGGLRLVSIGLQGSDRLNLEYYNRRETSKSFLEACNILARHGVGYAIDVILDNPYETKEDIIKIATVLNEIPKPYKVLAYGLTLFPGTELRDHAKREGMINKFGTDPYISTFCSTLPNKYKTPQHWRKLITSTPLISNKVIKKIINVDIDTPKAKIYIDKIYRSSRFKSQFIGHVRRKYVFLFDIVLIAILWSRKILIKLQRA